MKLLKRDRIYELKKEGIEIFNREEIKNNPDNPKLQRERTCRKTNPK